MEISGEQFYLMVQELDGLELTIQIQNSAMANSEALRVLPLVKATCDSFQFPAIGDTIQQYINQAIDGHQIRPGSIQAISRLIRSSFQNRYFVSVDMNEWRDLVGDKSQLEEIYAMHPEARLDIEEALTCLLLRRYTACVFHLMRALELVLREVGRKLEITVIDKNNKFLPWGIILGNIGGALDKMNAKKPKPKNLNVWREAHSYLVSVNVAFRTQTVHPELNYGKVEAFSAVRNTIVFVLVVKDLL